MQKRFAPTVLAAGLIAGTALGAVAFNPFVSSADPGLEVAQTDEDSTTTTVESDDPVVEAPAEAIEADGAGRRAEWLAAALAPLVADGTITQTQADAVTAAIAEAAPRRGPGGHRGGHGAIHAGLDVVSTALGITEDELRTQLQAGSSISDVATAQGVAVSTVIDALVADSTARIDEKLASGDITAEQAEEFKAGVAERITELVNADGPVRRGRGGD